MTSPQDYRRQLVEAALARVQVATTAGELLETIGSLAQGEGHPVELWRSITPQNVAGTLRSLESDGCALRDGERPSRIRGRKDPLWRSTSDTCRDIPNPPAIEDDEQPTAPRTALNGHRLSVIPPKDELDQYTPQQLRTLLEVGDELSAVVGRFLNDFRDYTSRARRRLDEAGIP